MPSFTIKGNRDGLLIAINETPTWESVLDELEAAIMAREVFFSGALVAVQVGERELDRKEIRKLRDRLAKHDVQLASLLGKSAETIRSARREEIDTDFADSVDAQLEDQLKEDGELPPIDSNEYGTTGVLVKTTLRSGRIVRHVGHVVVIGDVNPGAQIIAGGDVLVWGRLRGTVHAGAGGDEDALVCALDMRPMQLRIANFVAIASDDGKSRPHPEVATVHNGQIVAEEWGS